MEKVEQVRSRYRWWLDLRWIFLILVVSSAGMILWGLYGPEPRLIVSRETTFITAPLRPDGTPDYAAYVLDLMGRGTPPEENAAVALLRATWPMGLDDADLALVCKELGIPNMPPDIAPIGQADRDETLLRELQAFLALPSSDTGTLMIYDDNVRDRLLLLFENAGVSPWTAEECPPLAERLKRLSPALDLFVAAGKRSTYAVPPPYRSTPGAMIFTTFPADMHAIRKAREVLSTRVMLRVGEGNSSEAWSDTLAMFRLSRLLAPAGMPSSMDRHFYAKAMDDAANAATIALLDSPELTKDVVVSIGRALDSLPPFGDVQSILEFERLSMLDAVIAVGTMPASDRMAFDVFDDYDWLFLTTLDVNVALRTVNRFLDRIDAATFLSDHKARCRAIDDIQAEITAAQFGPGSLAKAGWVAHLVCNRGARSHVLGKQAMGFPLQPIDSGVLDVYERQKADTAIVRIAAALAEYRARGIGGEGKPYPDTLDELVPTILKAVPDDPCSGKPFHYERRGKGYLLYSVGPDGIDDGGTNGELDKGEWRSSDDDTDSVQKDVVVRLPLPKRSLIPSASDASN